MRIFAGSFSVSLLFGVPLGFRDRVVGSLVTFMISILGIDLGNGLGNSLRIGLGNGLENGLGIGLVMVQGLVWEMVQGLVWGLVQ